MNNKLADICDQLSIQFKRDRYRSRAYKNAAFALRNHPTQIISGIQAEREIKGIGKSIAAKIDEIIQTGALALIADRPPEEKIKEDVTKLFEGIHGVGNATSEKWYNQGYRTLGDIGKIYDQLTDAQKIGYKYYYHFQQRIPRSEMDIVKDILHTILGTEMGTEYEICGSYRRGEKDSGDIDCLVKDNGTITIEKIINKLVEQKIIIENLAIGTSKYMGVLQLKNSCARRIDILIVDKKSWPYATLYFTGSKQLNIVMRAKAIALGLRLNEYGMVNSEGVELGDSKSYPATSEEQIFNYLNVGYLEPHQRSIGSK